MGDPTVVVAPRPRTEELAPQPAPDPDPVVELRGPAGGVVARAPDPGARFTPGPAPKQVVPAADAFDPPVPVLRPGAALKAAAPPPPPPAPAGPPPEAQTSTTGPVTVHLWPQLGLIGVTLAGRPWVTMRWPTRDGREPVSIDVRIAEFGPEPAIGLQVRVGAAVKVLVNREAEATYAASAQTRIRFVHRYSAGGRPVEINEELPDGTSRATAGTDFTDDRHQGQDAEFDVELGTFRPGPPAPPSRPFAWRFDTRAQLDAWAAAHPQWWWVEGPPDGSTLQAMHADEKRMQWLAGQWRTSVDEVDVRTVYEKGVAWESPDPLWDLFYVSHYGAQEGPPGDAGECLVFRHDTDSYGRVPLSHEDALSAWRDLEAGGLAAPSLVGRLPRGELTHVAVKGGGPSVHLIGADYLQRREHFFAGIRAGKDLDTLLGENGVWWGYLRIALDRTMGRADPALRTAFAYTSGLWDAAGRQALPDIAADAKQEAVYAVQGAMNGIGVYRELDAVKRLVMSMPGMTNKARHDSITFLGFEGTDVCDLAHPLADRETAALVWMGQTVGRVSLEVLRDRAVEQHGTLGRFRDQIEHDEVEPLWDTGEFGRAIRERVYRKRGFTLGPRSFPHSDVPDRMTTNHFGGTELGYAFAVGASNEHSRRRTRKYLLIAAVVLATVVLVLVANAAGAMLAGLLFTEGTLAFMAVEVAVAAVIVTAAGPGVNTFILSGGTADAAAYGAAYAHWDRDLFWNVVSFGVLKALSTGIRSAILVSAGVKEADQLSRGWKAAEIMTRASLSGLTMYGLTGLRMRLEGKEMPEGEQRNEMIFEMGLSLVLMEFAGFAVSKPMRELSKFARDVRLGDQAARMDALLIIGQGLARETALYAAEPGVAGRSGKALLSRQIQFLEAARAVVEKLRSSVRTRVDGERLAARLAPFEEMISARLDLAADFSLMASTRLRPASLAEGNREFTYERGRAAELEAYYKGKGATVRTEGDTLFVTLDGKDLILRPEVAAGVRPDGSRVPEALDAWRLDLARRRTTVLAEATDRASADADVRRIRDADPFSMDAKALTALESVLSRTAARLAKVTAQPLGPIDRSGTDSAGWRTRLADARQALLARAEILGISHEPEIVALRGRGRVLGRRNLADNTLAVQQELVKAAQQVVDRHAGVQRSVAGATAALPGPDIAALQTGIRARQADVRRRADIYGIKPGTKYLEAVKRMRPGKRGTLEGLREAEAVLEAAEARLDATARRALADAEATHGRSLLDEVRADPEFALWTDAQIGDALRAFGGSRNLTGFRFSAQALRGALWAAVPEGPGSTRSPIGFEGVRGSPENLTFVLETYGLMRDLGIEGSFALLRRAVSTRDNFKGGLWQMEVARNEFGLENVQAFEFAGGGREVDILLKDGRRVETKDWSPATWDPAKVRKQMTADLEGATAGGTRADGINDILWLFRSPPPRSVGDIRSTLRTAFDTWLAGKSATLTPDQITALRTAFDGHADLVQAPDVSRTGVTRPTPQIGTGVPPRPRDDEKAPPLPVAP